MNRSPAATLLLLLALPAAAEAPEPLTPDQFSWSSPPGLDYLKGAWVIGSEAEPGVYAFRVRLAEGGRIAVHTHPDERFTTVLTGTLLVGFDTTFDEENMVHVAAGSVYVAPADTPHYLWARDGDVEYQESGTGPTATQFQ